MSPVPRREDRDKKEEEKKKLVRAVDAIVVWEKERKEEGFVPTVSPMSATAIMDEAVPTSTVEPEPQPAKVEFAECGCCGLTEECTLTYIARVRERYSGRWVCGLCAEAVKEEILRSDFRISTEEALDRHMNFCNQFRSSSPPSNSPEELICAVRHILRRSLESPRTLRSSANTPRRAAVDDGVVRRPSLPRSDSCFPTLAG